MQKSRIALSILLISTLASFGQLATDLTTTLPIDPNVKIGKLSNGITYYIRKNQKPEKRAELRLAVNAGSNYENDDQQGLAHFVEHMAFNGSKNFKKNDLINFLESAGIKFGAHLNAYTSFDETVYMLQLPTDSEKVFTTGFQVLEDWAHNLLFDSTEIEKERGVVISERRNGLGSDERMNQITFPVYLKDSRYADRLPIGKLEVLEKFKHQTLKQFYSDWYRPDLMAVIAVGDFDIDKVEQLIKERFSNIPAKEKPKPTQLFDIPYHKEMLITKATDKEASYTTVQFTYRHQKEKNQTYTDYRKQLAISLYNSMLSQRISEIVQQPNPPFAYGSIYYRGSFGRMCDEYNAYAMVSEKNIERGFEALLVENERVKRFGFTQSELDRQKISMLRGIEKSFSEKDKTPSTNFINAYVSNFLVKSPAPSIEFRYDFYKKYVPTITLDEINSLAKQWITDNEENSVITINAPDKPEVVIPSDDRLREIIKEVKKKDIKPYEDSNTDKPLMATKPTPGKVVSEKVIKAFNITEWTLSNGIKVAIKPTDFKNDELLISSYSPGGTSLVSDKDYLSADFATDVITQSGIADFDMITLKKMLTGKIVSISPTIGELNEGISGYCSQKDLETAMQLINLHFTQPRKDDKTVQSLLDRIKTSIENSDADPETAFGDTMQVTMSQYHYRSRPMKKEMLKEIDVEKAFGIYKDRFADAGDFTFVFVGNFKPEELKPLVETYLGSLPTKHRKESWKDIGEKSPVGLINKTVKRGVEPKSEVNIQFTGAFEYKRENRVKMNALTQLLKIKLREAIREDKGGTYGVSAYASMSHFPKQEYNVTIDFGCDPKNTEDLTKTMFSVLDSIKKFGAKEKDLVKIRESMKRDLEVNLKENRFWSSVILYSYIDKENLLELNKLNKMYENISSADIKKAANKYLNMKNYAKFVWLPEK